jgi:hypothetical protein
MQCKLLEVERGKKAEGKINDWLKKLGNIDIRFITQATKGSLIITTIFYD